MVRPATMTCKKSTEMPNTRVIDLNGRRTKAEVLDALGEALQLGGPAGANHPVRPGEAAGWGMNWDALFDCLLNLHSGGIWGSGPRIDFPFKLVLTGARGFAQADPRGFAILADLLEQTRDAYARTGRVFEFDVRH
jgi:hypothetical protein